MIELINIYTENPEEHDIYVDFLYEMLSLRKDYMNISHKKMPSFEEHKKFVQSVPYNEWFIVKSVEVNAPVGTAYVSKDDEIGIFLMDHCWKKGYGKAVLNEIYDKFCEIEYFYANIAPYNSGSIAFFVHNGFGFHSTTVEGDKIIQYTYCIKNPKYLFADA